jgi:hypothetical protein
MEMEIQSTKYPKHNKNYIEILEPPNNHYLCQSEWPMRHQPNILDDSREVFVHAPS